MNTTYNAFLIFEICRREGPTYAKKRHQDQNFHVLSPDGYNTIRRWLLKNGVNSPQTNPELLRLLESTYDFTLEQISEQAQLAKGADDSQRRLSGAPALETKQQTNKDDMSQPTPPAVEQKTFVDGFDVSKMNKEETLRALAANNKTIKDHNTLLSELGVDSPAITKDIEDRKAANAALLAHLETVSA